MKTLAEISLPKDTVNDDEVLITDILFANGECVKKDELMLVYETSKASVEVEAPETGFVQFTCAEGEYAPVGSVIARIMDEAGDAQPEKSAPVKKEQPTSQGPAPVFSASAQRYMDKKDIDSALFAGCDLVSLDDVLRTTGEQTVGSGPIPVVILGGGGHGMVLGDLVACNPSFRLKGYLDDGKQRGDVVDGFPVLGVIPDIAAIAGQEPVAALVAAGLVDVDPTLRTRLFDLADAGGALLPPFVHSSATVDPRAILGRGVQIHAGAVVGPEAVIEDGAVINTSAVISHHCRVGKHTHIAPGAVLAGAVTVGAGCLIGMSATAYLGISIGDGCVVENGVNLLRSVPAGEQVKA